MWQQENRKMANRVVRSVFCVICTSKRDTCKCVKMLEALICPAVNGFLCSRENQACCNTSLQARPVTQLFVTFQLCHSSWTICCCLSCWLWTVHGMLWWALPSDKWFSYFWPGQSKVYILCMPHPLCQIQDNKPPRLPVMHLCFLSYQLMFKPSGTINVEKAIDG